MVEMKKAQGNSVADSTAEPSESVKKLYKSITEVSHFLDDQRGRSLSCKDLFTISVDTQRIKLKNYCERMMLADPLCYGRKAEDIMWRKTYHDVYSTAKILRKDNDWNHLELALLENHFQSGIGCYYHLLFKFQAEIKFNKLELFDFFLITNDDTDNHVKKDHHITLLNKNDIATKEEVGLNQIIYRCLICLGDLSRYMYELNKLDLYYSTACRYYKQALNYKPDNGLPHNQIGRLALSNNKHLDAVYRYIRCIFSLEPFEGGEKNLMLALQEKCKSVFLEKLFYIFDVWFTGKENNPQELDKIYSTIISMLHNSDDSKNKNDSVDNQIETNKEDDMVSSPITEDLKAMFTNENVFKIVVIIIACLNKFHQTDTKNVLTAGSFFLSFMEYFIGQSVTYCANKLPPLVNPNIDHVKLNRQRRRRGFRKHSSPDSQEWSEGEEAESVISPDDESDDDGSEEEILIFDIKGPNDNKSKDESDGSNDSGTSSFGSENKKPKSPLSNIPFIETIMIYIDWIKQNKDLINPEDSVGLFNNVVIFLNYLSQANIQDKLLELNTNHIILPEEIHLRGMTIFFESKKYCKDLEVNTSIKNEDMVRLVYILHAAEEIALNNSLFNYDKIKKWFSIRNTSKQTEEKSLKDAKRDKQHVMGQLWLRSEVDNLEYKMKYSSKKKKLPTCIVVDTDALINYSLLVKKLVRSAKFIVVVPAIVISALDELKKLSKEVRRTIRWLEFQLQQGNSNLKSQGIQESRPIKMDYVPKLSKEIFHFKHILECCNYFSDEYGENSGLVTLTTGSDNLLDSADLMQMAKSIKINVEHIKTFQLQSKLMKANG